MSHVFISYSSKNRNYANKLADKLRQYGIEVWIDQSKIQGGDEWWEKIEKAITDCVAFLVIMSPDSKTSKWVKREMHLADNLDKPTFPLLLAGNNWSIYVDKQFIDVSDGNLPVDSFYSKLRTIYLPKAKYSKLRFDGIYQCITPEFENHYLRFMADNWVEIYNEPKLRAVTPSDRNSAFIEANEDGLFFKILNRVSSFMHSHEYSIDFDEDKLRIRFQHISNSIVGEIAGERPEIRYYIFVEKPAG
jgi:hypothetical protein